MEELADEKAEFCYLTGIAPSEYDGLTKYETNAFVKVHNKIQKKR